MTALPSLRQRICTISRSFSSFSLRFVLLLVGLGTGLLGGVPSAWGQSGGGYDASWYEPGAPYVQIDVAADGVYRVEGSALQDALPAGTALADIAPETIRLLEKGREVPIQLEGTQDGQLDPGDTMTFVGQRNRGGDELWAYDGDASAQSSSYYSLYSDTTTYWMTWGGEAGLRYQEQSSTGGSATTTALRDTLHVEEDNRYYFGRPSKNGNSLYTESEGYFWRQFQHNSTGSITFTDTLAVGRRVDSGAETLDLSVRLDAATFACHRVEVEAKLRQSSGAPAFESLTTVEWKGFSRRTPSVSVAQDRIPGTGLEVRLTSYNGGFSSDLNCSDPSSTPNFVLLDWIEAAYTRTLAARGDRQRFVVPTTSEETYALTGHAGSPVSVYNPRDARRFEATISNGSATVTDAPSTAPTAYWAAGPNGFRAPAAVRADAPSDWSSTGNTADYLILTTESLRPSAQRLADYRETAAGSPEGTSGYDVEIALVQNVFDEFDYGRPTPIAIRRFVRATQQWDGVPRFLSIFADAQYPIDDGSVDTLYPEWSVPSFGYSPSDGWFAMQTDGPEDWSEVLAIGRIPVRSVAQGDLFVEKLKSYEQAPLQNWQKRMLLLAGGTSVGEQNDLQSWSNWWGEIAADTLVDNRSYSGPGYTGMDTLRYYKKVTDALDASFQDSLAVDIQRGAGWLNYFGHSAAQTWEIVTDPPSEFDNAGQLPIVVSLGCRTGSFAGGRFEEKSAPSLGEQLVVGSVRPDGTPREGALNGGIAHFGESALGNLIPSARINDELVQRVFLDTSRVLGPAIRSAKADIAARFGSSSFYVKHLLQYGLIGDPATQIALPDQPDLHLDPNLIAVSPVAPTPSDELTVSVRAQSRGLIPTDSVTVRLTWERPDGRTVTRTRRVERFPLERTLTFTFSPTQQAIGTNTFRATVDPNDAYAEENETDNTAERTQTVFSTGVSLISPTDFGVAPASQPTLRFSVTRQGTEPVPVEVQLDTVPDFSSPFLRRTSRQVDGLVETWTPSGLTPNTTYYWRARASDAGEDTWTTSQFTVASAGAEAAWRQTGRFFAANDNQRLTRSGGRWAMGQFDRNVSIMSERGSGSRTDGFVLDGASDYEYLRFGFGVLVVNGLTGRVRSSLSFPTYDVASQFEDRSEVGDQQEAIDSLRVFLDEVAREGDYVFVRTRHLARGNESRIPDEVKSLFRNLGSTTITSTPHSSAIDTLTYGHVWVMATRKGFPEETVERVSPPEEGGEVNEILYTARPSFAYASGRTLTPRIGPASEWSSLSWSGSTANAGDNLQIDVLSADSTVLIDDLSAASGDRSLDAVSAATHPYLRLRATLIDSTDRTAPQLTQWSVSYRGVPELAVDPAGLLSLPDTLQQGARTTVTLPVANLGPVPSDTVRVDYEVTDAANVTTASADTLAALAPGARDSSSISIDTEDRPGQNTFSVRVGAEGPPERLTSNNAAVRSFFVRADTSAPSVRVLSNGRRIPETPSSLNDIQDPNLPFVSTDPSFEIIVEDDNENLPLDTSTVAVYLKSGGPDRGPTVTDPFRRLSLQQPPDSGESGTVRVLAEPSFEVSDSLSSTYTLKVEAEDAKGNSIEPYQGSFRVQTDQVIRDLYPYPNPMSDHTTFAFRVEGGQDQMLRDFTLRIYTLSGRLVRTFDQGDLDTPLGVGWNTLRWNGRDADGDRVATGVYLYRVRVEGDDQTFRGDVEKVTVIR